MAIFNRFPYSNFHGINMDWILEQVKLALESANRTAVAQADLTKYVNDYFKNLNISEEVQKKLDEMSESGELSQLIAEVLPDIGEKIAQLETDIAKKTGNRNFILIGDSFGGGVVTAGVDATGWIGYCATAFDGWANVYNNTEPLGGVYGFASSRPFLDVLKDAETKVVDKYSITDIVVLGGTNDIGHENNIISAIRDFALYCHEHFPNATIKIGVLGTDIPTLQSNIVPYYSACTRFGCEYIADTSKLLCLGEYVSSDGVHLTSAGYDFYNPYIVQAVLCGHVEFSFYRNVPIVVTSPWAVGIGNFHLTIQTTNNGYSLTLFDNKANGGSIAESGIGFIDNPSVTPAETVVQFATFDPKIVRLPFYYTRAFFGQLMVANETDSYSATRVCNAYTTPDGKLMMGIALHPGASNHGVRFYNNAIPVTYVY